LLHAAGIIFEPAAALVFGLCFPLLFLAGCGLLSPLTKPPTSSLSTGRVTMPAAFWKEVKNWQGVPYRYGGMNDTGVDCSGLAVCLYENLYGITLPRTTSEQRTAGVPVSSLRELAPGDLVFFTFRDKTSHVGIYLEDRRFTHASQRKGVTISRLDNPFWRTRYRTARRILPAPPKPTATASSTIDISDRNAY